MSISNGFNFKKEHLFSKELSVGVLHFIDEISIGLVVPESLETGVSILHFFDSFYIKESYLLIFK